MKHIPAYLYNLNICMVHQNGITKYYSYEEGPLVITENVMGDDFHVYCGSFKDAMYYKDNLYVVKSKTVPIEHCRLLAIKHNKVIISH